MDETAATGTLASPSSIHAPLPTIPFDLIPEILCRLSVKLLIQLKCVCKSWNSLISDPKFAKKHLRMSTACHDHDHHLIVANSKWDAFSTHAEVLLSDSTISSIFSNLLSNSTVPQLKLVYAEVPLHNGDCVVSSRDGILLFDIHLCSPVLWNPSIRKFKILPPFLEPSRRPGTRYVCTFGYDHFIDNYKIFATCCIRKSEVNINLWKREVSVYTLGYDSRRRIDDIPGDDPILEPGIFVSGSVNWLAFDAQLRVIVSLDLEKESYRKLLMPYLKKCVSTLGVLRDSLCIFTNTAEFLDVWVMKEYGIKESWTKLFSVPYVEIGLSSFASAKVVYASEDDQVLLAFKEFLDYKLIVYNFRNGTFKIPKIRNISAWMVPKVYVESLISPCS